MVLTQGGTAMAKRLTLGFGWGVVATVAMSVLMVLGVMTGMSPMPRPIPAAIVAKVLGEGTPTPLLMLLAAISHLVYGGFWGAVLSAWTRPVTIGKGIGLGVFLWFIMQVVVLPFLGWGLFGSRVTLKIALATLVLHVVYGGTLGWLVDRNQPSPKGERALSGVH
jgi:hypothetical protein